MATFNTNSSKGYFLRLVVNETSQSIANNTTTLSWSLTAYSGANNSMNRNNQVIKASINGTSVYSSTRNITLGFSSSQSLGSGTITVGHGTDGSKSVALAFSWQTDNYSLGYTPDALLTASTSMTLTKIPRASSASLSTSSPSYGGAFTVNISRHSTSFTHEVTISLPGKSTVITGVGTGHTFTIPSDWMTGIPNATTGAGTVKVQTKNGSTNVGSAVSMSFTASVPSNIVPSVSFGGPTYSNYPSGFESRPIIGHTTISCTSSASGTYGSSISSYSWSTNGASATSQNFSFKANTTGHSITITVRDSRGRTASATKSVNCVKLDSLVSALSVSSGSINYGSTNTVHMNRHSSSFTHTVALSLPHRSASWTGQTTSTAMSVPAEWMNGVGTSTSASAVVTVTTYWGGTTVGSNSISFTAVVPSNIVPTLTFNQPSVTSGLSGYSGSIIGVSTIQCSASYAGTYSSEIRSVAWSTNGHSGNSSSFNFTPNTGTHSIRCTVTDSRGRTATIDRSVSSVAYSSPNLSAISCQRCTGDGTVSSDGQYIRFVPTFSFTNIENLNNPTLTYSINTSPTTSGTDASTTSGKVYSPLGNNTVLKTKSYVLSATITDKVGRVSSRSFTIPVSEVLLNFPSTANALGIGMYNQGVNRLDIGWDTYISNNLNGYRIPGVNSGTASQSHFGKWAPVGTDGVMEIGRYIDFHSTNTDTSDYTVRMDSNGGRVSTTSQGTLYGTGYKPAAIDIGAMEAKHTNGSENLNDINDYTVMCQNTNANATSARNYPIAEAGSLIAIKAAFSSSNQIYHSFNSNRMFIRGGGGSPSSKTAWQEVYHTGKKPSSNDLGVAQSFIGSNHTVIRAHDGATNRWMRLETTVGVIPPTTNNSSGTYSFGENSWRWGTGYFVNGNFSGHVSGATLNFSSNPAVSNAVAVIKQTGTTSNTPPLVVVTNGQTNWGVTAELRTENTATGLDRPGLRFATTSSTTSWTIGQSQKSDDFAITKNRGLSNGGTTGTAGGWGDDLFMVNPSGHVFSYMGSNDTTTGYFMRNYQKTTVIGMYTPNNTGNLHLRAYIAGYVIARSSTALRSMDEAGSGYKAVQASTYTTASEKKWKRNIKKINESYLDKINKTTIFEYDKTEGDDERHEIGLIIDEGVPKELITESITQDERTDEELNGEERRPDRVDKFVDLYSMISMNWKASQELSDQDDAMEADITYQGMIMEHQEEVVLQQQADLDYQDMIIEAQELTITKQQADIDFMLMIMEG